MKDATNARKISVAEWQKNLIKQDEIDRYLENGKDAATFDDLVGPQPTKYIKRIAPVDGEDYRKLTFKQGEPLVIFVPSLKKVVRYDP